MTREGRTHTQDISRNAMAMSRANNTVDDLIDGKPVPVERVGEAMDTFLDTLWGGKAAARHMAQQGLVAIYRRSADPADRAELLGELFAAGEHGRETLQELVAGPSSTALTAGDLTAFLRSAHLPIEQRLQIIAERLEAEGGEAERPHRSLPHGAGEAPLDAFLDPEQRRSSRAGKVVPATQDPPDGALSDLKDERLAPERRQARALELGRAAVPHLAGMLRHAQPAQLEFAMATLIRLGRTPAAARAVHQAMQQIEADHPAARRAAEFVRDAIENDGQRGLGNGGAHARERARGADVPADWLRAALESCNSENILRAATGREVLAIALGARVLHQKRSARP